MARVRYAFRSKRLKMIHCKTRRRDEYWSKFTPPQGTKTIKTTIKRVFAFKIQGYDRNIQSLEIQQKIFSFFSEKGFVKLVSRYYHVVKVRPEKYSINVLKF